MCGIELQKAISQFIQKFIGIGDSDFAPRKQLVERGGAMFARAPPAETPQPRTVPSPRFAELVLS